MNLKMFAAAADVCITNKYANGRRHEPLPTIIFTYLLTFVRDGCTHGDLVAGLFGQR